MSASSRGWLVAALLALTWALGPALPALWGGELLGHGLTDLYPSVWGMWWFAGEQPGLPLHNQLIGAPQGLPFYYSSPIHGWLAWPLLKVFSVPVVWNLLTVAARAATVLTAYGAGKAWGLDGRGALVAAAVFGCAPLFHGYAVEGIVEGVDGWTLAAWCWAVGARKPLWAALAFALTVLSSWYLGAVACVLAALMGPRAWLGAAGGLLLVSPALWGFLGAFTDREPLSAVTRAAMGTQLMPAPPSWLTPGLNPFAKTSWLGLIAPVLALLAVRTRSRLALGAAGAALVCWLLSLGVGPVYELPPFSSLRFPYRFHVGALAGMGLLAGVAAQRWRLGAWLAPCIALEGLLLSPVEMIIPGAPAQVPDIYHHQAAGPTLDIPGPLAMPPGQVNMSRPRARWFLYMQTGSQSGTPWVPDFNSVGVAGSDALHQVRQLDPLLRRTPPEALQLPVELGAVMVHRRLLGSNAQVADALLRAEGWERTQDDGERWLYLKAASQD